MLKPEKVPLSLFFPPFPEAAALWKGDDEVPTCVSFLGLPQATGWLNTEICHLTVLEANSPKSGYHQGHAPSEACKKNPSLLLPSSWWFASNLWSSLACRCITPNFCLHVILPLHCLPSKYVCVQISPYWISVHPNNLIPT